MTPVRWSHLRYMADCPAMYKYVLERGVTTTPAMRFGALVHALVLGKAPNSFVVFDKPRRGNAWKDFQEEHQNSVEIVTADEWERASACADAVKTDPVCGPLLRSGVTEHRMTWAVGGRQCAGTPDLNGDILLDLKVTPMANPAKLPWHARKMLWHAQLDWYRHGVEAQGGSVTDVYLVTVTPKPPHLCVAYQLTPETLELGTRQWRALFERLLVCEASDEWPGYTQSILPLDLEDDEMSLVIEGEEVSL